jgi:hypothetical protein
MKHRTGVLIGTLLLTIFLVSTIFPASAYSYSGNKWDATYVVPKKDSTIPSSWSSALTAATDTWNNAGASFTFRWMTSAAQNTLSYSSLGSSGPIASSYPTVDQNTGYLTRCRITFNSAYSWSTSSGGTSGCYDVQAIATHEFGHWLMLLDLYSSADTEKTMYGYATTNEIKKRTLTSDDIEGIRSIY